MGLLLGLNYYVKQSQYHVFGVTTIIIALITYCIASHCGHAAVVVLRHGHSDRPALHRAETHLHGLAQRMKNDEMITLAKFLAISGIILPMLPNENLTSRHQP